MYYGITSSCCFTLTHFGQGKHDLFHSTRTTTSPLKGGFFGHLPPTKRPPLEHRRSRQSGECSDGVSGVWPKNQWQAGKRKTFFRDEILEEGKHLNFPIFPSAENPGEIHTVKEKRKTATDQDPQDVHAHPPCHLHLSVTQPASPARAIAMVPNSKHVIFILR